MVQESSATFKIGLLGPTQVGKTSLVTALLAESQVLLAGSGVAMRTLGVETEDKIASNRRELEGDLLAGEFRPGSLRGNVEPFTFTLKLDPGVEGAEINFELLDFPGGWLSAQRPEQHERDWQECRHFITNSTVLLVPVDAAVLMEAAQADHKRAIPHLLTTFEVEQIARDWAIERNRRPNEPALVAFCPVNHAKAGGLADVIGALPGALKAAGEEPALIVPAYASIVDSVEAAPVVRDIPMRFGAGVERFSVLRAADPHGVPMYLIDHPGFFARRGIYGENGNDYPDNMRRFVFFGRAAAVAAAEIVAPDVVMLTIGIRPPCRLRCAPTTRSTPGSKRRFRFSRFIILHSRVSANARTSRCSISTRDIIRSIAWNFTAT